MTLLIDTIAAQMHFACRLSADSLLCYGTLPQPLAARDVCEIGGVNAKRPYLGAVLHEGEESHTLLLLTPENGNAPDTLSELWIRRASGADICWKLEQAGTLEEASGHFSNLLENKSPLNLQRILYLLTSFLTLRGVVAKDSLFARIVWQARQEAVRHRPENQTPPPVHRLGWIMPNVLLLETELPTGVTVDSGWRVLVQTRQELAIARVERVGTVPGAPGRQVLIAVFPDDVRSRVAGATLTLIGHDRLLLPDTHLPTTETLATGDLVTWLNGFADVARPALRANLGAALRRIETRLDKKALTALRRTLQQHVNVPHLSVTDPAASFGINVEQVFPLDECRALITGWVFDPLAQLATLDMATDAGEQVPLMENIAFHARPDVEERYRQSRWTAPKGKQGFVVMATLPEGSKGVGGVHFTVQLDGGLRYTVTPGRIHHDPFLAREELVARVAQQTGQAVDADAMLAEAASAMQKQCVAQASASAPYWYGEKPNQPDVSIVIPLYRNLDYLPVQLASFSQDPDCRASEIILVLDDPADEARLRMRLSELHQLYGVSFALVVMSHNSGFAAASNAGARAGTASELLFMNADVMPIEKGWLQALRNARATQDKPGTIAPRLLYEDGSLQHAGMYFSHDESLGVYANRHYYKGYPASYAPVQMTREVPANSAACLLVARSVFEEAGGFATDYIIGDFEDSDLCLTLQQKGYTHYCVGEVALYHPERQSLTRHPAHGEGSAATRFNAVLHHRKWQKTIAEVMRDYG